MDRESEHQPRLASGGDQRGGLLPGEDAVLALVVKIRTLGAFEQGDRVRARMTEPLARVLGQGDAYPKAVASGCKSPNLLDAESALIAPRPA